MYSVVYELIHKCLRESLNILTKQVDLTSSPINSGIYMVEDYKQQLSDHLYLSHYTKIISRLNLEISIVGFVRRKEIV